MILNLTNENKEMVCRALAEGIRYSNYNLECASAVDVRRHEDLISDVFSIIQKIALCGVNIKEDLKRVFRKEGVEFDDKFLDKTFYDVKESPDKYNIQINSHSVYWVIKDDSLRNLFIRETVFPVEKELFTIYNSSDVFEPTIKLNLNKEGALEYLLKEDEVFNEAYNILEKELEDYIIEEVICVKTPKTNDVGSEIRIKYSKGKDVIYAVVNEKGIKSDILLIKDNLIYKVMPLKKNIFYKKSIRRVLSKNEVIKYKSVLDDYDKANKKLEEIESQLVDNLNLSPGEKYAYAFADTYIYEKYKEIYSDDIIEFEGIDILSSKEDINLLSEKEYTELYLKKKELNKAIDIVKSALINEDLRESYRQSRIELATNIVQFNVKSESKLYNYQYKDVSKLVSRFDNLIKIK